MLLYILNDFGLPGIKVDKYDLTNESVKMMTKLKNDLSLIDMT